MKTELLEAFLSGDLSEEEAAGVETVLSNDESLREVYLQQMKMDAALRVLLAQKADVDATEFSDGVIARLKSEGGDFSNSFSKSVLTEIIEEKEKIVPLRWPDFVKAAAVASIAALLVVTAMRKVDLDPDDSASSTGVLSEQDQGSPFLARIQSSKSARWSNHEENTVREDGWISNGVIEIEEGIAEIGFNSGARAYVEGPSRLSVESENRIFLESGRVTAEVSNQSPGFTINTPRMNIVDIGTRFGVLIDDEGDTEVHVMEGVVEVSRASGNSATMILREGLALKADSRPLSSLLPISYAGDQFALSAGEWNDRSPVIFYDFDESGGGSLMDTGNGRKGGPYDLSLIGGAFDQHPKRAPGLNGSSLVFGGGQFISTPLSSDFRLDDPFTVSFWIKIPPKVGRKVDDTVIGFGRAGAGWEIGCRNLYGNGALMVTNGDSRLVGSTDLADGKWHHVAVRFIGGDSVKMNTHLHLYVDGKLETISSWRNGEFGLGRTGELRIGDLEGSGFPGWIDQVAIFDEAISTRAIQTLSDG